MNSYFFMRATSIFTKLHAKGRGIELISQSKSTFSSETNPTLQIKSVTIDNPSRGNVLSSHVIQSLKQQLVETAQDPSTAVCILKSNGKFFCTGHDLKEIVQPNRSERKHAFEGLREILKLIETYPVPIIASIQGPAFAAGCQLVASCSLAIASSTATFAVPGIKLGLFCSTPAVALVRAIGKRAAAELLYTGKAIDATRAYELGLIHRICAPEELEHETLKFASEISCHSSAAMRIGKATLDQQVELGIDDAYELAITRMCRNMELEDTVNGVNSFVKKQPLPDWKHR
ncbi:cytochrome c oxidase subunit 1 [Cichlidogyrus casuarinus]|uniref:Enoyl-CoA hydratase domain-containing protein 3, mitochondrial n=1 Tax=Cichlidogyrus casuarinus TaxID=1844966 RepID=A0ABD2Q347_9PLAT